jgi:arylsulfatase A-like enzyme
MMQRKYISILIAVILCIAVFWLYKSVKLKSGELKNVILISIDTCRADYLGCYGYKRKTTPNIDALANEGILFENAYTPVPLTLPAHCSMLTGTNPPYHGVHDNFDSQLGKSNITLAEILKGKGLTTGGIIGASLLNRQFGISKGFDTYNDQFDKSRQVTKEISERRGEEVSRYALKWLNENKRKSFFLFLHYYDAHDPYTPPEPFASRFVDNLYAGEIAYVDYCIGEVIKKLKELKLYDSTLVIITGDHGQMLGEHGEQGHGYFIYQGALKVPLIFKMAGKEKPGRVTEAASLIDIVPTVCGLFKADVPKQVKGRNLLDGSLQKDPKGQERYLYCETLFPTKYKANSLLGIVGGNFKYIQTTRPELYDIAKDPEEKINLIEIEGQRGRILQDHLKQILDEQLRKSNESELQMSEETRRAIESLGYVGGKVSKDFEFDQSKDDPKDLLDFHNNYDKANELFFNRKNTEAKRIYQNLIKQRPQIAELYIAMSDISMQVGDYKTAEGYLRDAVKLDPSRYNFQNDLGVALANQKKFDDAAECFKKSLEINPNQAQAHNNLGMILVTRQKLDEGIAELEKAIEIDPAFEQARYNIIDALTKQREQILIDPTAKKSLADEIQKRIEIYKKGLPKSE